MAPSKLFPPDPMNAKSIDQDVEDGMVEDTLVVSVVRYWARSLSEHPMMEWSVSEHQVSYGLRDI
jgi:hypothetical protein